MDKCPDTHENETIMCFKEKDDKKRIEKIFKILSEKHNISMVIKNKPPAKNSAYNSKPSVSEIKDAFIPAKPRNTPPPRRKTTSFSRTVTLSKNKTLKGSYSPSVNKRENVSESPKTVINKQCDIYAEIWNKDEQKCTRWNIPETKKYSLDNLNSKKKINCKTVTGPKQYQNNCWFNVFHCVEIRNSLF